jgi:hypothetical protein
MAMLNLDDPVCLLRLRTGDTRDLPILPDAVYQNALTEKKGNMKAAAILCGQYILATLAFDGQQQLGIITIYGQHVFAQYQSYLMMLVKDPDFNQVSPIPYAGENGTNSILEFKQCWDKHQKCCYNPTYDGWEFV